MRLRLIPAIVVTVVTALATCACGGSSDAVTTADGKTVLRYQGWIRWKSTGVAGAGGVIAEKEIQLWIDWLTRSGEPAADKLTAKSLHTNEFNPYANGTYREGAGPDGQTIAR